ncbi:MAG: GIY-YIG nuclease family protein [Trueperaceae bacterium]|nr:MAG: GIY-YIG nuclease family protein [Trueperaceae bacterium]
MPGVYELADAQKALLYIGQSAKDVPNRIRQHLIRHTCLQARATYWRYIFSRIPQAEEEVHLRRYLSRHGDLPPCNKTISRERDGKKRYRERSRQK